MSLLSKEDLKMANMTMTKTPMPEQAPDVRNKNFEEVTLGYTEEMALNEAARCLNCKNMPCVSGCPVNIHIPQFISKVAEGDFKAAYKIIAETNSLPAISGRVCPQESQCEMHCVRGIKGEPVGIGRLERFVADWYRNNVKEEVEKPELNGKKVAVVGSGPSSLTCASDLAKKGYEVTVFEAFHVAGGVLVYGIPEFRLPKSILERYKEKLIELGIKIRPNTAIGTTISVDDMFRDGYSAIFIGTGVWKPNTLHIKGETLGNVHYAINYLTNPDVYRLGDTVNIIGAGNSAMDVARTALRHGAKKVTVFSRSDHLAASQREVDYAKIDGVEFVVHVEPVEIVDDGVIFVELECDGKGNLSPIRGTENLYQADSTIIAISQGPKDRIVSTTTGLEVNEKGLLVTNTFGETTRDGIFASGDVVRGAKTVVEAVAYSKQVADAMDDYMKGLMHERDL